ncbi:MAG: hypothetical protein P4N59_14870 [Negativicutes bacterium]|nr:hypothetical protein [Negativicutes bacterium]
MKTHILSPGEIEQLLQHDFGNKLQPVDSKKLAKQHHVREAVTAYKIRSVNCTRPDTTKP